VVKTISGEKPSWEPEGSQLPQKKQDHPVWRSFRRFARYMIVRVITLFCTMTVGIYLAIMIANMGGYVDTIVEGGIREAVGSQAANTQAVLLMSREGGSPSVD